MEIATVETLGLKETQKIPKLTTEILNFFSNDEIWALTPYFAPSISNNLNDTQFYMEF
jgi:hypothetical protein